MVSERIILNVKGVSKQFEDFEALKNTSFKVNKGDTVAIMGPSGAGKTVLLKCIAGLEPLSEGIIEFTCNKTGSVITINGDKTTQNPVFGRISMVFQDLHLWPHMTVLENIIEAPIRAKGVPIDQAIEKANEICDRLDVLDQLKKYPNELSIGQQQRVAIARTLAIEPEIILLDEITSALDPERIQEITKIIEALTKLDITMIIVTHQLSLAKKLANKYVFFFQGELLAESSSLEEEFIEKLPDRVKRFLIAANL